MTPFKSEAQRKKLPCGCWDEDVQGRAFTLKGPQEPMPEKSDFTDNCMYIRHYCDVHWVLRNGSVGYRVALDKKLDTLRSNLRDTYGVEPKGDQ